MSGPVTRDLVDRGREQVGQRHLEATVTDPDRDHGVGGAHHGDLDAAALLLTTRDQVTQTVAGLADYGGSLDVILDDAKQD